MGADTDVAARPVVNIRGPTACGKTDLALALAAAFPVEIISVDSAQVYRRMDVGTAKPALDLRRDVPHWLIDIREPHEFERGHIPGAVLSPRGLLEFEIHGLVERTATDPDVTPEDRDIVLYCGTGGRSALAADTLDRMGYRNVRSMDGGIVAWAAAHLPVDIPR